MGGLLIVVFLLLLAVGLSLLRQANRGRQRAGLPSGRVIYAPPFLSPLSPHWKTGLSPERRG
jgi:hypothetical protein